MSEVFLVTETGGPATSVAAPNPNCELSSSHAFTWEPPEGVCHSTYPSMNVPTSMCSNPAGDSALNTLPVVDIRYVVPPSAPVLNALKSV